MREDMTPTVRTFDSTVIKVALGVLGFAIACCMTVLFVYKSYFSGSIFVNHEAWGQFGDFFGGTLNPILAMLSLLAILGTLIVQSRELSYSTSALQEQSDHLNLQAFENTFFSMIQLNNDNVKTLDLEETESKDDYSPGRGAFRFLKNRLESEYERISKYNHAGKDEIVLVREAYAAFSVINDRFVGHYFGGLDQIFEFIDLRRPLNRKQYYDIVKAQLSVNELVLLFYRSLTCSGALSSENLNRFYFFDKLPSKALLNEKLHSSLIIRAGV